MLVCKYLAMHLIEWLETTEAMQWEMQCACVAGR
jgi:hypothetical protein